MEESKRKRLIIKLLACACIVCAIFAIIFCTHFSYSATVNVNVPAGSEVTVYVGGDGVTRNEDGSYSATVGSKVSVTVVNENKLFKSLTINGKSYSTPVVKNVTVPATGDLNIQVATEEPFAEDKGSYFGNPYLISKEADILALAKILRGEGTSSDYGRFGAERENAEDFRYGYFRLTTNVFLNSSDFYGLGTRAAGGVPFQGCFDFAGYAVTISITRTTHIFEEFHYVAEEDLYIADYGFFSLIYGAEDKPCLVRNAVVQGYIAVNTVSDSTAVEGKTRINAGGVAGTSGKNVVLENVESQVSVSARVASASLYIGGVFGICSTNVEGWSEAVYDGEHNNVSGVTYGEKASVYAGCFCGVLQNAYADGVTVRGESAMVLANSLNGISGAAVAGGFAGVVVVRDSELPEFSEVQSIFIRNVNIVVQGEYNVHSVITNNKEKDSAGLNPVNLEGGSGAAIAGGFCGTVYRPSSLAGDVRISLADVRFIHNQERNEVEGRIQIKSQTQDGTSSGMVFAGGAIGYVYTDGIEYVDYRFGNTALMDYRGDYLFDCSVDISAVQNGVGPVYAGGVFGFNAFNIYGKEGKTVKFHITSSENDFTVSAVQSASSGSILTEVLWTEDEETVSKTAKTPYPVCAGGVTSFLQSGFNVENVEFSVKNGKIRAYREVGSTAIGDIAAGGFAGAAVSYENILHNIRGYNGTVSGTINNLSVTYSSETLIEASCYSFDSVDNRGSNYGGNNAYAGGAIGIVAGYSEVNGVTVEYQEKQIVKSPSEFFVYGMQNAAYVSGNDADLKSEGFVGGVFGLIMDTRAKNLTMTGNAKNKTVLYFESSNNPNTASVGGIIGAAWRWKYSSVDLVDGASVTDVHVAGKAYSSTQTARITYDIYVGGALGVFANPNDSGRNGNAGIKNIDVKDCVIESIGEDKMATYAAGVVAGVWWSKSCYVEYCTVSGSSVTASSVSGPTYAAGLVGLVQSGIVLNNAVIDTDVRSVSVTTEASAAGIFAWAKDNWTVENNVSDATIYASGVNSKNKQDASWTAGIGHPPASNPARNAEISMKNNYDVSENAGSELVYRNTGFYADKYSGAALHLVSYGVNEYLIPAVGGTVTVYPNITSADALITIKSSNEEVASVITADSGVTVTGESAGVAYIGAYATVNGKEYLLCAYPVTVEEGLSGEFSLKATDGNGEKLTDSNTDGYCESSSEMAEYIYFRHETGNSATADVLKIAASGLAYFPCKPEIYESEITAFIEGKTSAERLAEILAADKKSVQLSSFNGRAVISFNGEVGRRSLCTVQGSSTLKETVIIIMEFDYNGKIYGVVIELVPNEVISLSVFPDEGTPPLSSYTAADGKRYFVFVKGDTVRFTEKIAYRYEAERSYIVETSYSGTGVSTNGTLVLSGCGPYEVTCTVLGTEVKDTVYIEVKDETPFDFELLGADVTSDRKMITDADFAFGTAAQPGYGLQPSVKITIRENVSEGLFKEDTVEFVFEGVKYTASFKANAGQQYSYSFVLPASLIKYANGDGMKIGVTYSKTYSLVFLTNFGTFDFFKTIVPADAKFSEINVDGLEEWLKSYSAQRYGYDFAGFYQVGQASELSSYGKSFSELTADSEAFVNGSLRFYARWLYNVTVEASDCTEVKSSFPAAGLNDGYIVPADDKSGFGFTIEGGADMAGSSRFDAFVKNSDGTFTCITADFISGAEKNSYEISSDKLNAYGSGYIYIVSYSDSMEFYTGDIVRHEETELYSDGVFTAVYNVNYGTSDGPKNFSFDFIGAKLPKGTSLRLYYAKNSVTEWSGGCVLQEETDSVPLSAFASLKNGGTLAGTARIGAKTEEFILVVTLPVNTDCFGIIDGLNVKISVNAYKFAADIKNYGETAAASTAKPLSEYPAAERDFTLYKADIYTIKEENGALTAEHTGLKEGLTDRRRGGDVYMWKIEKKDGGAIGDTDFSFTGLTETVRTTTAVYFMLRDGEAADITGLSGYTISFTEVKNAQQPAHGLSLYVKEIA